ncbi:hypothetical protein HMPREF0666_01216 [Prevotella sp. C561]|nr:hypothetical protein HMPREF0666_01216 [Prevotella sp. C561]
MKRLVIIAEGETEESFVNNILRPFFVPKDYTIPYNALRQNTHMVECLNILTSRKTF